MRKHTCALIIMLMAVMGQQSFAQQTRDFNGTLLGGCVISSDNDATPTGIYRIQPDGTLTPFTQTEEAWATGGGVLRQGVYYLTCFEEIWEGFYYSTGFAYDIETWQQIDAYDLGTDLSFVATDMAYDAATDSIYGCFYDGTLDGYEFGTIQYGTEVSRRNTIATLDVPYIAVAAMPASLDSNDKIDNIDNIESSIYAVDCNGNLLAVNKANGHSTLIGRTPLATKGRASAAIDPHSGLMYITVVEDAGSALYTIDTQTAATTLVCRFTHGEEITGLFAIDSATMSVPRAVSAINAEFIGNSLTGTVTFTAPTHDISGEQLSGDLTYTITANSNTVATGNTAPGAIVNAAITLPSAGMYTIAVSIGNTFGQSRSTESSTYVGDDVPAAVGNVRLTYTDGRMSLTWDAPVGKNGGFIDAGQVRYDITRIVGNDSTLVTTGLAATSFSEPFAAPEAMTSVKYSVTATYLGQTSDAAASNAVLAGSAIVLPYVEHFDSDGILDLFTIIDANNDGRTWHIAERDGYRCARIDCNEQVAMDDWLITPALTLQTGVSYSISFNATTYNSPYFPERLEMCVGNAPTIEAMQAGTQLIEPSELKNLDCQRLGATFTPTTDGTYYIGLHGMSDADMFFIIVDDITVAAGTFDRGPDIPSTVNDIRVTELTDGRVKISWSAPTTDINGRPLDTPLIYKIIGADYRTVVDGLAETEYIHTAVETGEQDFVYYYIGATNDVGTGDFAMSDMILVGTPYSYPYEESFADGVISTIFGVETPADSYATWEVYTDATAGIEDADGNNGFIGMQGAKPGDCSSIFTGKISLVGAENPVLSFYYNALVADNKNTLNVAVREVGTSEWTTLSHAVMDGATTELEWIHTAVSLEQYSGKVIQIQWTPTIVSYTFALLDGIRVGEAIGQDLATRAITAPKRVNANTPFDINVAVANNGLKQSGAYTVELYRDDQLIHTANGSPLACGARTSHTFNDVLGVTVTEATYHAVVVYDADTNLDNNMTGQAHVTVSLPTYPTASNLDANVTNNGVVLTWDAPDLSDLPLATVTEDFEQATALSQSVDGWTFVDGDRADIGAISGFTLPYAKASWFVMDYTDPALGLTFASHSGTKHLSTMFNYNGEQNDDWIISPLLSGTEQTITFWARSYTEDYGLESMQFLYSTTDSDLSSFVANDDVQVPGEWTEYSYVIPDGATYFAIRCTSQDVFMLFVDDITYTPYGATPMHLDIIGYNIYRDGVKLNDTPIATTSFTDTQAPNGQHTYVASVVYAQGESAPSTPITIDIHTSILSPTSTPTSHFYDLQGRRISTPTHPGIYIQKHRKRSIQLH